MRQRVNQSWSRHTRTTDLLPVNFFNGTCYTDSMQTSCKTSPNSTMNKLLSQCEHGMQVNSVLEISDWTNKISCQTATEYHTITAKSTKNAIFFFFPCLGYSKQDMTSIGRSSRYYAYIVKLKKKPGGCEHVKMSPDQILFPQLTSVSALRLSTVTVTSHVPVVSSVCWII